MRRFTVVLLAASLAIAACGGDDSALTANEREWCSLADATEESAAKFDRIFETGAYLNLDMGAINAYAREARANYEADGMSPDEAVKATSDELLENEDYIAACKLAYSDDQEQNSSD